MTIIDRSLATAQPGPFAPLVAPAGYLPIKDYGLIGDGATCALVGRDGALAWCCVPRFDSPPLFCSLLDATRGGQLAIRPVAPFTSRQYYLPDTAVLVTEMATADACLRIMDCMLLKPESDLAGKAHHGQDILLRYLEVLMGELQVEICIIPRPGQPLDWPGAGEETGRARLQSSLALEAPRTTLTLASGSRHFLALCWGHQSVQAPAAALTESIRIWQAWAARIQYEGSQSERVRRSVITLKLLTHAESGALIAAATSSLPEQIGGGRNWDYRYTWIRDGAFAVQALRRAGFSEESHRFFDWLLEAIRRDRTLYVLYTLDGGRLPSEQIDRDLCGYRHSAPVRWGNGADSQVQHDAWGELLDLAWQCAGNGELLARHWPLLRAYVDKAASQWQRPDRGIWEVRSDGAVFTYSAALCQVALTRGVRLANTFHLPGRVAQWQRTAARIVDRILTQAWDAKIGAIRGSLQGGGLDASVLTLPLRGVIDAQHPKMIATVETLARHLSAGNGLLYRYLQEEVQDGLAGDEGAFLLCSFWLVDTLALQGRIEEAEALYAQLCSFAGPLGLLPEEIDTHSGDFLGNYPQAFSHIGVINSGFNIVQARAWAAKGR